MAIVAVDGEVVGLDKECNTLHFYLERGAKGKTRAEGILRIRQGKGLMNSWHMWERMVTVVQICISPEKQFHSNLTSCSLTSL